jgi:hypothetical protein
MAHVTVPATEASVEYTVGASPTTGPFTVPASFTLFSKADLRVRVGTSELTQSQFTFTGSYDGGYAGGSISLVTAVSSTTIYIWRDTVRGRSADFPEGAPVPRSDLNTEFDRVAAQIVDLDASLGRALRAPDYAASVAAFDLAANAGMLVGVNPGGTGFEPVSPVPASTVVTQAITGGFFEQNGARINRLNDRLFLGGATINDGLFPNVTQDWFTQFQVSIGVPVGTAVSSIFNAMNSGTTSETGAVGVLAAIQSKYFASAGTAAIGTASFVVNDNTTLATNAYAIYGEAHKTTSASGSVYACELDTRNTVASITPHPFQQGNVIGLQIASGAEYSTGFDGSAAIQIANNLDKWKVGINFVSTAITGTDGVTGTGTAIAFARGHAMRWYNSSGVNVAEIVCNLSTAANGTSIAFSELGLQVLNSAGNAMAYFFPVASAANQVTFTAGAAGTGPLIAAIGSDTNVDLRLDGQGAGRVRFGTYTAGAVAQAGYIEVKDSGGTIRRLLVG